MMSIITVCGHSLRDEMKDAQQAADSIVDEFCNSSFAIPIELMPKYGLRPTAYAYRMMFVAGIQWARDNELKIAVEALKFYANRMWDSGHEAREALAKIAGMK